MQPSIPTPNSGINTLIPKTTTDTDCLRHPEAESLTSDKEISRGNEMEAANQQPNEGPVQTRSG